MHGHLLELYTLLNHMEKNKELLSHIRIWSERKEEEGPRKLHLDLTCCI